MDSISVWNIVKSNLTTKHDGNKPLKSFIGPVDLIRTEQINGVTHFYFSVPSALHQYWLTNNIDDINTEISSVFSGPFHLEFIISSTPNDVDKALPASTQEPYRENHETNTVVAPSFKTYKVSDDSLNPDYTFSTFVVGKNNEFAHAATYNIAQNPGTSYNPLFICGPVGMGKTHLLIAAGNLIKEKYPHLRTLYVSVDRFYNDCVSALRHNQMDKFRQKYRQNLDVLLIDDIQGLNRGESVMEEFFNTLNELFEKKKQVIVAADRLPREIQGLEDRIRSRLEWGMTVHIHMPDLETRVAILKYKAEKINLRLPEDVITYIARISKTSIRELEGNLNKLKMYSELQGLTLNMDLAKDVLATQEYQQIATIEDIQRIVCEYYKIKISDLKGSSRVKSIVVPRQACMYLIEKHLGKSLTDIGRSFGNKDHTTVINARDRIKNLLKTDPDLKRDIDDLTAKIHTITGL